MSGLTGLEPATSRLKVEGTNSFTTGRNGIDGEQPTRCLPLRATELHALGLARRGCDLNARPLRLATRRSFRCTPCLHHRQRRHHTGEQARPETPGCPGTCSTRLSYRRGGSLAWRDSNPRHRHPKRSNRSLHHRCGVWFAGEPSKAETDTLFANANVILRPCGRRLQRRNRSLHHRQICIRGTAGAALGLAYEELRTFTT